MTPALPPRWQPQDFHALHVVHVFVAAPFSITHAMCYPRGGLPTLRYNEVLDDCRDQLPEVRSGVAVEPIIFPLSGEVFRSASSITSLEARSDIKAIGFWTRRETAIFFCTYVPCKCCLLSRSSYRLSIESL